jgi:hypothetical protein
LFFYAVLCAVIWFDAPALLPVLDWMPRWRWLGVLVVTLIGPALLLVEQTELLDLFAYLCLGIGVCLATAWYAWRRWPETEYFAIGLTGAALLWGLTGWFVVMVTF